MGALLRKRGLPCPIFGGSTSLPWPACFEFRGCFSRVLPRPVGTTLHRRAAAQNPRHGPARNPRPSFRAGPHGIYRRGGPEARSKCSNGGQRGSRSSRCPLILAPGCLTLVGKAPWPEAPAPHSHHSSAGRRPLAKGESLAAQRRHLENEWRGSPDYRRHRLHGKDNGGESPRTGRRGDRIFPGDHSAPLVGAGGPHSGRPERVRRLQGANYGESPSTPSSIPRLTGRMT